MSVGITRCSVGYLYSHRNRRIRGDDNGVSMIIKSNDSCPEPIGTDEIPKSLVVLFCNKDDVRGRWQGINISYILTVDNVFIDVQ